MRTRIVGVLLAPAPCHQSCGAVEPVCRCLGTTLQPSRCLKRQTSPGAKSIWIANETGGRVFVVASVFPSKIQKVKWDLSLSRCCWLGGVCLRIGTPQCSGPDHFNNEEDIIMLMDRSLQSSRHHLADLHMEERSLWRKGRYYPVVCGRLKAARTELPSGKR